MAFDPSTAQAASSGFDPSSAQSVGTSGGFDAGSAQPYQAAAPAAPKSTYDKFVAGMQGSFDSASLSGLIAQPVKTVMSALDTGGVTAKLKEQFPGQTDQWYSDTKNKVYDTDLALSRQKAAQAVQDNQLPQANLQHFDPGTAIASGAQKVANFASGMIGSADPTWLLNPGGAIENGIAASGIAHGAGALAHGAIGVASHAAGMGAIGAVSDAAAQGMDIAAGAKKDFDVNQDLQAAAYSSAFGGAMRAASPFVAKMFADRGVNTTPGADPRTDGTINPTTDQQLAMNATDHAQYMHLLNTGSVDDIKNFMQGKQGPQPSYSDVNKWVEYRDAQATQGVNAKMTNPDFNYQDEYNRQTIESHVNDQMSGWKNAPDVNVVHSPSDIADPVQRQAVLDQGGSNPNSLGVFGSDGTIHLFSGRIADAAERIGTSPGELTNSVLFHEGLGHFGLQQQFGNSLDNTIKTLLTRNVGQFGRDVDAWQKNNPGAYGGDRVRAGEEVLANMSNKGVVKPSVMDAVTGSVRKFGRQMGLKMTYSDAEVSNIVRLAQQAVLDGKGSNVRGNGYKFMFTGPSAAGFDPATANIANDGVGRNEISDAGATLKQLPPENGAAKLGDVIDHPELFNEYPHLKDTPVLHTSMDGADASYSPKTNIIYLNSDRPDAGKLSTLLHETQHAIQVHEDYPTVKGADTYKMESMDDYMNHPLEKEAFATENRLNMSTADRVANGVRFATVSDIVGPDTALKRAVDDNYVKDTRTLPEIRRNAYDLGVSPSDVKGLSQSQLSVLVHRLGTAGDIALSRIDALNDRIGTPKETVADRAAYLKTMADLSEIVPSFLGNASEAGRAMRVVQAFPNFTLGGMKALAEALSKEGSGLAALADDPEKFYLFQQSIQKLMKGNNPQGAIVKLQAANKPYWEQYVNTFHFNAMLSGLGTQFKAIHDMATGIFTNSVERLIAGNLVAPGRNLYEAMTGKSKVQGVSRTEAIAGLSGLIHATMDLETYRATLHSALTGDSSFVTHGNRTPTSINSQYGMNNPHIPIVSIPTQLISAHDTFFRSESMMEQLYALGDREALKTLPAGHSLDDRFTAGAGFARNPTPSMLAEALDQTNRTLLLNSNPLNKLVDKMRINYPGQKWPSRLGAFIANTLAPFIRVESNSLLNRVIQRSPLGLLDPYTQGELNAGGARSDMAMARILYGSAKIGLYWAAAAEGKQLLTGKGSDNPDKYKEQLAAGITPDSSNTPEGYHRADLPMQINPFGTDNKVATQVKDIREAYEKGANVGQVYTGLMLAFGAGMQDMVGQSWINDFQPAIDAVDSKGTQGTQKFGQFLGNEAKTFVPAAVNQVARLSNPNSLDTTPNSNTAIPGVHDIPGQVVNDVASAIPGNPAGLPTKFNVYGDPEQNGAGLFDNGNSKTITDPAELELHRIGATDPNKALITPVLQTYKDADGDSKKMIRSQFEQYQQLAGHYIVEDVRQEMQSADWAQMPDKDKWDLIKSIQSDQKANAREKILGQ